MFWFSGNFFLLQLLPALKVTPANKVGFWANMDHFAIRMGHHMDQLTTRTCFILDFWTFWIWLCFACVFNFGQLITWAWEHLGRSTSETWQQLRQISGWIWIVFENWTIWKRKHLKYVATWTLFVLEHWTSCSWKPLRHFARGSWILFERWWTMWFQHSNCFRHVELTCPDDRMDKADNEYADFYGDRWWKRFVAQSKTYLQNVRSGCQIDRSGRHLGVKLVQSSGYDV